MLSPENSRMLAMKRQIAVYNKDFEMARKIEGINSDKQINSVIKNYKIKED